MRMENLVSDRTLQTVLDHQIIAVPGKMNPANPPGDAVVFTLPDILIHFNKEKEPAAIRILLTKSLSITRGSVVVMQQVI